MSTAKTLVLSKDDHKFLERVAAHLKTQGVTANSFNADVAQQAMIDMLKRDIEISKMLMDRTPATQKFRDDFARRVYDACKEST